MAHNTIDEIGNKYGRLIVISRAPNKRKRAQWTCACDCGSIRAIAGYSLRSGKTQSCGCLRKEQIGNRSRIHGKSRTPEYKIWKGIRVRCYTKGHHSYTRYGAKGITIDSRWDDFQNFYDDMGPRPSPKHSIDRINNNGSYGPDNCRWATPIEQANNKSRVRAITHNGKTMTIKGWAQETGIHYNTLYQRIVVRNWPIDAALTIKPRLGFRLLRESISESI